MSWSRIQSTGAGQFDWRVLIAGYPTEFVSSEEMEMVRPLVTGESGWSTSNYYAGGDILKGGSTMVRAVMFRLDQSLTANNELFSKGTAISTDGQWGFYIASGGQLDFRIATSAGDQRASYTVVSGDVGRTLLLVGTFDGTSVSLYVDGTLEDSTLISGTFGAAATDAVEIGRPSVDCTIIACAASDSVSTVGDADEYWKACKTAGTLAKFTGIEHLWRSTSPSSLASDLVGSAPMTLNGSVTVEGPFRPNYDGEDGRERICCLERGRDLVIDEQSNPIDVIPQQSSVAINLIDKDEKVTEVFAKKPSKTTWLSVDLPRAGSSMSVLSESGWKVGDYAHVGLEATKVTATSTGTLTVSKGQWDTVDVAHYTEDGAETRRVEVTDHPRTITGRRVKVYAYGEGDGKQGEGTLVWSGIAAREPEFEGARWTLTVDNTARLLTQTLGTQLGEPLPLRGIFYHAWCNLRVQITEYSTSAIGGSGTRTAATFNLGRPDSFTSSGAGFFESQEEFLAEVNTAIDAAIAAAGFSSSPTVRAVPAGDGTWGFQVTPDSTGTRYISIEATSPIDGETSAVLVNDDGDTEYNVTGGTTYNVDWLPGEPAGARTVPRGGFGPVGIRGGRPGLEGSEADIWRLFVGGDASLTGIDAIVVEWPQAGDAPDANVGYFVASVDTTNRYLQITPVVEPDGVLRGRIYTQQTMPQVKLTRTLVQDGHLGDLIQALVDDGRDEYARFGAPFITVNDFDTSSFDTAVLENAAGRGFVLRRNFMLGGEVELGELLKHEARMCGAILFGFNDGLIEALAWRMPVSTDPDVISITELNDPLPTWQQFGVGSVKGALIRTGYNPFEDDWTGVTFQVIDVVAQSRNPLAAMVEVEPRSVANTSRGLEPIVAREAEDLMELLVGAYGYPYAIVRLDAPFTALGSNVRLGKDVKFTPYGRELPKWSDGTGDAAEVVGKVIGRRLDFQTARISLTLFVPGEDIGGYSPAHYVSGQSNTVGDTWSLTLVDTDPLGNEQWGESTDSAVNFLSTNDKVEVYQWNVASPTVVTGTVDSISGNTATVTFDSTWTPGIAKWVLRGQGASNATTNQQLYVHFGGEDGRIAFGTERAARVFSG